MSIFDKLKKASGSVVKNAAPAIKNALSSKKETFTDRFAQKGRRHLAPLGSDDPRRYS